MVYIQRKILASITHAIGRGKSVLLLGPRQAGKSTLLKNSFPNAALFTFANIATRLRYEQSPVQFRLDLLYQIEQAKLATADTPPLIIIDEVQKIPEVMDVAQELIDEKKAIFILTGSSARKLKHNKHKNLLPGRVVKIYLGPLSIKEIPAKYLDIHQLMLYGSLPDILLKDDSIDQETDLQSYVNLYLEDEIRSEALVRSVANFSKFLELAAIENGNIINFTQISQDVGVASSTIIEYYRILEDCLIATRIDPISNTSSRRRLTKAPRYLFFDLGVSRIAAKDGNKLALRSLGKVFENFIGIQLLLSCHTLNSEIQLYFYRTITGIEVDYVLSYNKIYIPIEVKFKEQISDKDLKHLKTFLDEHDNAPHAYIICTTPAPYKIRDNITVLPWQDLEIVFRHFLDRRSI